MTEILFHGPEVEYYQSSASYLNPWPKKRAAKFPRSDAARIERMDKYVEWKRSKLRQRVWIHLWAAGAILVATPLAMAVVSYAWKFGLYGVLG